MIVTSCESLSLRNTFVNLTSLGQARVDPQGAGDSLVNFYFKAIFFRISESAQPPLFNWRLRLQHAPGKCILQQFT